MSNQRDCYARAHHNRPALASMAQPMTFGYHADIDPKLTAGKDVMLIMATGGGKSVCFQLPPLLLNRGALIISPTIAIMKDQVRSKNAVEISRCF